MHAPRSESVFAVVPARGGSKGIPGKNLVDLGGKPLLQWTIDAALDSGVIDRVMVSSDDDAILASAEQGGAVAVPRTASLAEDHVHAVHPVLDLLEELGRAGDRPDRVVMLLPTSPFRTAEHITEAVALHVSHNPPSVISVTELDKQIIHLRYIDEGGTLEPLAPFEELTAQRQEQRSMYGLNGSIYVADVAQLLSARTFHVPGAMAYVMPAAASIDINEPEDLAAARQLLAWTTPNSLETL